MKTDRIQTGMLVPVLFSFFVMGFVDMVGISVSYVKNDFPQLSDTMANLIPMMAFIWFAIFSLPTGRLMGAVGRRRTVLLSAAITAVAMAVPMIVPDSFPVILMAFALLGIGNTVLQVSLNPLLTDIVPAEKVTGMLALGQFVKAVSSTLAPILIGLAAGALGSWKYIFPIYCVLTVISWIWLFFTKISERPQGSGSGSLGLLFKDRYVMMMFSIIILIVGFEVGLMTAVPKYLGERFGMTLEQGGFACSLYYVARTIGTFAGSFLLSRVPARKFQVVTLSVAIASFAGFMLFSADILIFIALFLIGLCCANVFAVAFGEAINYRPAQANEISALMITGVAGGALIPPVMGVIADHADQTASLFIPLAALVYILAVSLKFKKTI